MDNIINDITFEGTFDLIQSENGITFTQETNSIKQNISNNDFVNGFTAIKFYYNSMQDYISSNLIYFINKDKFPSKVESSTIYVKKGASSYTLKFDHQIDSHYFTYKLINLSPLSISSDSMSAVISYPTAINANTTHTFKLGENLIQVSLVIPTCTLPQFLSTENEIPVCKSCSDIDSSKSFYYYKDSLCYSKCPVNTYQYENQCVDNCAEISHTLYNEDKNNIKKCVTECSIEYGRISKYTNECIKCESISADTFAIDGFCEAECAKGALYNVDNDCILPNKFYESFEKTDKCDGFCEHGNCTLVNNDPYCTCPENYYGVVCEVENEPESYFKTIDDDIFPIFNSEGVENTFVDVRIQSTKIALDIKGMISYSIQKPDYLIKMNTSKKNLIKHSTRTMLQEIKQKKRRAHENIFQLVWLALRIYFLDIKNAKRNRNLRQLTEEVDETVSLIKESQEALIELAKDDTQLTDGVANIISDQTNTIFYQYSKGYYSSLQQRVKNSEASNISIIDFTQCKEIKDSYYIITTDIVESLRSELNNEIPSTLLSVTDGDTALNLDCSLHYKLPLIGSMNPPLFNYYLTQGIDIYNQNDEAFTEKCYYNKDLPYDTTPSYRRENLYQKQSIVLNDGCSYVDTVKQENYIVVSCPLNTSISYTLSDAELSNINDKTSGVPINCPTKIDSMSNNVGFWIYTVCIFILIMFSLLFIFLSKENNIVSILVKEKVITDNVVFSKVANTEHATNPVAKPEDVKVQIKNDLTEGQIALSNFLELHPIPSLGNKSVLVPPLICLWFFVFNTLNVFGFNALYFNNTKIENRIYRKDRDNFAYPMRHEFDKIIYSILSMIALNVIVRAISLVTIGQRKELGRKVEVAKGGEEQEKEIGVFTKSMMPRRLIAMVFMLVVNVFFWYYAIVFCGIYIKTQYGWAYSGIWSLFFNWVIFANIEILILSVIEFKNGSEECVYYFKKLFLF